MPIDFRKPRWILVVVVCIAAGFYSWYFFSSAFPILDLEISMDRNSALHKAQMLANRFELGPDHFRQSASFHHDKNVQNFVELEGGGKDAFREMIRKVYYQPYRWHVRHYREGQTRETLLRFTPDGRLYGFREKWPEDDQGPALKSSAARDIAEKRAINQWKVDLSSYELISHSRKQRTSGRVDHTFTYERTDIQIGKGNYRLRLGVNGDQLSEVTYFVHVPEAFKRRYANMRSANSLIQNSGNVFVYLLYVGIGCFFGAFWLLKRDALKWRIPLLWGGGITLLLFLSRMNALPLKWMNYDTAMARGSFLVEQVIGALSSSLIFGVIITLSFITAEGLTRMAFGHQPRLWKLWNPEAAGSKTVSTLTLLGYLLIGPYFAYNVALYSFAHDSLGWWTPSSPLLNPNILAHYVTWLQPVTNALRAGFWEECLFRAVPLASAALIGSRFGKRNWFVGITLVLQALVFGAGHASYATQPSYARVVELFSSSLAMGGLYLAYGLLPIVIIHFLYDLALMALPLFVSSGPWMWVSRMVVVVLGAMPLLVVMYGRFVNGEWKNLPERFYNHSWSPDIDAARSTSMPVPAGLSWTKTVIFVLAGMGGFGLWFGFNSFENPEIPLSITRNTAEQRARSELKKYGVNPDRWMATSYVSSKQGVDDSFVWQKGGESAYRKLMGSYLHGPRWIVRYITFEGSVTERAEEYRVRVAPGDRVSQIRHVLPESASGSRLSEKGARTLADSAVQSTYSLSVTALERVSAEPKPRPNRRDWVFEYRDPHRYPLDRGEARIKVQIAGSEVTGTSRYVHVPETFRRDDRNRQTVTQLIDSASRMFLYLIVLGGAIAAIVFWGKGWGFSVRVSLVIFLSYVSLMIVDTWNQWPTIMAQLNTAEPFFNQILITLAGRLQSLVQAVFFALMAGLAHGQIGSNRSNFPVRSMLLGLGIGVAGAGLTALAGHFAPDLVPTWASYASLDQLFPWIHHTIQSTRSLLTGTILMLLFAVTYFQFTRAGRNHSIVVFLGIVVFGFLIAGMETFHHWSGWAYQGLFFTGLFLVLLFWIVPDDRSFVPMAVAGYYSVQLVHIGWMASHPYALPGVSLAIVALLGISVSWARVLQRGQTAQ